MALLYYSIPGAYKNKPFALITGCLDFWLINLVVDRTELKVTGTICEPVGDIRETFRDSVKEYIAK